MAKDKNWESTLKDYLERAQKKQNVSDKHIMGVTIANKKKAIDPTYRENLSKAKTGKGRPDMLGENNPNKDPKNAKKISEFHKGKAKSKEQVEAFKQSWKTLPIIKCPHCKVKSRSKSNMERYHLDNCNKNPKSPRFIKEVRVVKTRKKQPRITCPHCNKTGGANAMKRLHFDNCKYLKG